eukprot:11592301-Alexandrium_andersonii.AAC.1
MASMLRLAVANFASPSYQLANDGGRCATDPVGWISAGAFYRLFAHLRGPGAPHRACVVVLR